MSKIVKMNVSRFPKPCQNPLQNVSETKSRKYEDVCRFVAYFCIFSQELTLKIHAPRQCFASFFHQTRKFTFCIRFWAHETYQKLIENAARTTKKSTSKTACIVTSAFWHFGLDFERSWASKSVARSARRVKPHLFHACVDMLHEHGLWEARTFQNGGRNEPCCSHLNTYF